MSLTPFSDSRLPLASIQNGLSLKLFNKKTLKIYLTTDETTKNKFNKVFNTFDIVEDPSNMQKNTENILICDNFDFEKKI